MILGRSLHPTGLSFFTCKMDTGQMVTSTPDALWSALFRNSALDSTATPRRGLRFFFYPFPGFWSGASGFMQGEELWHSSCLFFKYIYTSVLLESTACPTLSNVFPSKTGGKFLYIFYFLPFFKMAHNSLILPKSMGAHGTERWRGYFEGIIQKLKCPPLKKKKKPGAP